MKKTVVVLIVFILLVAVLGIVSAEDPDPACKGLCNAFSKCDRYSPQYWVLASHIEERDCDLYCKEHINESISCDGLTEAAFAVGPYSPACPVIQGLMIENGCDMVVKECAETW